MFASRGKRGREFGASTAVEVTTIREGVVYVVPNVNAVPLCVAEGVQAELQTSMNVAEVGSGLRLVEDISTYGAILDGLAIQLLRS